MAESQMFDIPNLDMDEIMACFRDGVVGDMAINVQLEHIKSPTPQVMMQICTSILSKLGVDPGILCQPHLRASMEMKHADMYLNTFKPLHVVKMMNALVPIVGRGFTLTDLTTPRPKRLRKLVCACINFFKARDDNMRTWDAKFASSVAAEAQLQQSKEVSENNKKELLELKSLQEDLTLKRQDLAAMQEKTQQAIQVLQKRKEEKELLKVEAKNRFTEVTASLEKKQKQLENLKKQKENLHSLVVGSPKRHVESRHEIQQRMKIMDEKQAEAQGNLREVDRVISQLGRMQQLLTDSTQMTKDNISLKEGLKKVENERQSQTYETSKLRLGLIEVSQNTMNLKQQILGSQEKMARANVRAKQMTAEFTSTMEEHRRIKEDLESEAGDVHKEVMKEETKIRSCRSELANIREEHEKTMSDLENKKQIAMTSMDDYMKRTRDNLENCEVAKALAKGANSCT